MTIFGYKICIVRKWDLHYDLTALDGHMSTIEDALEDNDLDKAKKEVLNVYQQYDLVMKHLGFRK